MFEQIFNLMFVGKTTIVHHYIRATHYIRHPSHSTKSPVDPPTLKGLGGGVLKV